MLCDIICTWLPTHRRRAHSDDPITVLCLDSETLQTTAALEAAQITDRRHIVLIEKDLRVHQLHKRHGMISLHGTCDEVLHTCPFLQNIDVFYLDIDGSVELGRHAVLHVVRHAHLRREQFVLGYTFCKRTGGGGGSFARKLAIFRQQLTVALREARLRVVHGRTHEYHNTSTTNGLPRQQPMLTEFLFITRLID